MLFKPEFDLATVTREDVGRLGDVTCCHCKALLFRGEAEDSKLKRGGRRGRGGLCCSDGQVDLAEVQRDERIDELWCAKDGDDAAKAKLLNAHPRKFNNALALAYEEVEEPEVANGGWQPSVVIRGKMYHKIGPLQAAEGAAPAFAQLYVHDPSTDDDVADRRYKHMYLPSGMSKADRARCVELLAGWRRSPSATSPRSRRSSPSCSPRRATNASWPRPTPPTGTTTTTSECTD